MWFASMLYLKRCCQENWKISVCSKALQTVLDEEQIGRIVETAVLVFGDPNKDPCSVRPPNISLQLMVLEHYTFFGQKSCRRDLEIAS